MPEMDKREPPSAVISAMTIPSEPTLDGAAVLVVDDQEDSRELLATILSQRGAEVRQCESVQTALQALESTRIYLLVADIGMPADDGFELIARVRRLEGCAGDCSRDRRQRVCGREGSKSRSRGGLPRLLREAGRWARTGAGRERGTAYGPRTSWTRRMNIADRQFCAPAVRKPTRANRRNDRPTLRSVTQFRRSVDLSSRANRRFDEDRRTTRFEGRVLRRSALARSVAELNEGCESWRSVPAFWFRRGTWGCGFLSDRGGPRIEHLRDRSTLGDYS